MKGAARDLAAAVADESLDPPQHLLGGAPRERQQQDCAWRNAALDQPRDAINQRAGLARTGARDYQHRTVAMGYRGKLRWIEQVGVLDAVVALIGGGVRRPSELDYAIGHGGMNCSMAEARVAPAMHGGRLALRRGLIVGHAFDAVALDIVGHLVERLSGECTGRLAATRVVVDRSGAGATLRRVLITPLIIALATRSHRGELRLNYNAVDDLRLRIPEMSDCLGLRVVLTHLRRNIAV